MFMKRKNYYEKLVKEKEKLDKLVGQAIEKGLPIAEDEAVVIQNRKVDEMVAKIQREELKNRVIKKRKKSL